jgi:hypothetical protein
MTGFVGSKVPKLAVQYKSEGYSGIGTPEDDYEIE